MAVPVMAWIGRRIQMVESLELPGCEREDPVRPYGQGDGDAT
jgi:hypothetical protein